MDYFGYVKNYTREFQAGQLCNFHLCNSTYMTVVDFFFLSKVKKSQPDSKTRQTGLWTRNRREIQTDEQRWSHGKGLGQSGGEKSTDKQKDGPKGRHVHRRMDRNDTKGKTKTLDKTTR